MKKRILTITFFLLFQLLSAQYEIELQPNGLILPRLTSEQISGLNGTEGQMVFNTETERLLTYFEGEHGENGWISVSSSIRDENLKAGIYFEHIEAFNEASINSNKLVAIAIINLNENIAFQFQKDTSYNGSIHFSNNDGNIIISADPHDRMPGIQDDYEDNIFIGANAGHPKLEGDQNVMIGSAAGFGSLQRRNVNIGYRAGRTTLGNEDNVFIGNRAGQFAAGDHNVIIGSEAGDDATGSYNILIGSGAGTEISGLDGHNTLIIESYENEDPLIHGNFEYDLLTFNAKVGIGTTLPEADLHITNDNSTNIRIANQSTDAVSIDLIRNENNGTNRDWRISNNNSGVLEIGHSIDLPNNEPTPLLNISPTFFNPETNGTMELGSSTKRWETVWVSNGINNTSDLRLKKNIESSNYGLNEILQLRPVKYNWKKGSSEKKIGLLAQEVLSVIPEVVFVPEDDDEYMGMDYAELIPVLIKAIQELTEELGQLKSQMNKSNP